MKDSPLITFSGQLMRRGSPPGEGLRQGKDFLCPTSGMP